MKQMTIFFNDVKRLIKDNKELFDAEDIPLKIFHDKNIHYSGIQLTRYRGAVEYTGIGEKEVRALEIWYGLYCENDGNVFRNIQVIREYYIPAFTVDYIPYTATNLLVKKEINEDMEKQNSTFAICDRLEKYLYGNIKAFLIRVAGMDLKENDFISVKVIHNEKRGLKNTFHGGKLSAYDIEFSTNVYLPQTLRLGQAVALGYGEIRHR
ncbi:MAG: CRISPR-associated endonuclease Cas6 [Bacteroidales bacterium]|nr:CRISPR-associated endonuclease Cas6 [Bacteroidales bacterium]